jgi:hypothetical protein
MDPGKAQACKIFRVLVYSNLDEIRINGSKAKNNGSRLYNTVL